MQSRRNRFAAVNTYLEEQNVTIPVPRHPGDVPIRTLRAIIREMDVTVEKCNAL